VKQIICGEVPRVCTLKWGSNNRQTNARGYYTHITVVMVPPCNVELLIFENINFKDYLNKKNLWKEDEGYKVCSAY